MGVIIQARLSSTRMPGKVLEPFYNDTTILDIQLRSLRALEMEIVLATTINSVDDRLEDWAKGQNIKCFRGDEENVLKRFVDCAEYFGFKSIVRVCSDNPFLQVDQIENLIGLIDQGVEYASFKDSEDTPAIKTHWGLYPEAVSLPALKRALSETKNQLYLEHVTNYLYTNSHAFRVKLIPSPDFISNRRDLRFTIDTPEDFLNMQNVYKALVRANSDITIEKLIEKIDLMLEVKDLMLEGINKFNK